MYAEGHPQMFNLILLHLSEKHFTANEFLMAYWHRLERFNASFFFGKKVLSDSMSLPFQEALSSGSPCFLEGLVALFGMEAGPDGLGQLGQQVLPHQA